MNKFLMKGAMLSPLLLFGACSSFSPEVLTGEQSLGEEWDVVLMDGKAVVPADDTPYLGFDKEKMWGFTGCNRLTGGFPVKENKKVDFSKLASTMMMCPDSKYETDFMAALRQVKSIDSAKDGFRLKNEAGKTVLEFAPRELTDERLGGEWMITLNKGTDGYKQDGEKPFVGFDIKEKRIYGFAGCNRLVGTLNFEEFKSGKADFSQLGTTRMLCEDNTYEQALLENLAKAKKVKFFNNELRLLDGNNETLVILRKSK